MSGGVVEGGVVSGGVVEGGGVPGVQVCGGGVRDSLALGNGGPPTAAGGCTMAGITSVEVATSAPCPCQVSRTVPPTLSSAATSSSVLLTLPRAVKGCRGK